MRKTILLVVSLFITVTLSAQKKCSGRCKNEQVDRANEALLLSNQRIDELKSLHVPYGKPKNNINKDIVLLVQEEFIVGYDTVLNLPLWTSYLLTADWANDEMKRKDCFRDDPRLNSTNQQINCGYYKKSKFDRGHLSPRDDFNRSETAQFNTFLFSNMIPQYPKHNRGTWKYLEGYLNDLAETLDSIYIVTGIAFDYDGNGLPDKKDSLPVIKKEVKPLAIPSHLYKIVLHPKSDSTFDAIAILIPHNNQKRKKKASFEYLKNQCLVSIDEIEDISGLNFFWRLDNSIENSLEGKTEDDLL